MGVSPRKGAFFALTVYEMAGEYTLNIKRSQLSTKVGRKILTEIRTQKYTTAWTLRATTELIPR